MVFQCVYVIITISIKHFVDIRNLCKISFIVLTMAWAEKLSQVYKYLLQISFIKNCVLNQR